MKTMQIKEEEEDEEKEGEREEQEGRLRGGRGEIWVKAVKSRYVYIMLEV